jgi:PAS domain S-box-containing protein
LSNPFSSSAKIVIIYALVAVLWITMSDVILLHYTQDATLITRLQWYKGVIFIVLTSVVLYFIVRRQIAYYEMLRNNIAHERNAYHLLFNALPVALWLLDAHKHKFIEVNKAAEELFGYTASEFMQTKPETMFPSWENEKLQALRLEDGQIFTSQEWQALHKSGKVMDLQMSVKTVLYQGVPAQVFMMSDISENIKTSQELMLSLQEMDTFVYRASHDLRGPIARIIGLCQLADMETNAHARAGYLTTVNEIAKGMDQILFKLLTFNNIKKHVLSYELADLPPLIEGVVNTVGLRKHPEIDLQIQIAAPYKVETDSYLLRIILHNLIENSYNYRDVRKTDQYIRISVRTENAYTIILVDDNGIGIDTDAVLRIFDLSFRGTPLSKGTGMGLYAAKNAAQKMDGDVRLVSSRRGFTQFVVVLPVRSELVATQT